jgi:hypothetical protein
VDGMVCGPIPQLLGGGCPTWHIGITNPSNSIISLLAQGAHPGAHPYLEIRLLPSTVTKLTLQGSFRHSGSSLNDLSVITAVSQQPTTDGLKLRA